jgi:hypothetical protein
MSGSADIAIIRQHVLEAEEFVARPRELLREIERDTHREAAKLARAILTNLEKGLELAYAT